MVSILLNIGVFLWLNAGNYFRNFGSDALSELIESIKVHAKTVEGHLKTLPGSALSVLFMG